MAGIVIYGGSFAGVAAAAKAAGEAPREAVTLVNPLPVPRLGTIGTVGGQNFFDIRRWRGELVQGGSFAWWFSRHGQFYNTAAMAQQLYADLSKYPNMRLLYGFDLESVEVKKDGRLASARLRSIRRGEDGLIRWGPDTAQLYGDIFVDASDDGRLARLAGAAMSSGRRDWPEAYLPDDEVTGPARQQAATLMFQVRGVQPVSGDGDLTFITDGDGTRGAWGGSETYRSDPVVRAFNDRFGPQGFALKPLNAAQDGTGSDRWWVNGLLMFRVDGRAGTRDRQSSSYPADVRPEALPVDEAWVEGRRFLSEQGAEVEETLRRFPGFEQATLVRDREGRPVVGEILYIREAGHAVLDAARLQPGTEESNYALTASGLLEAGDSPTEGADATYYGRRIGLAYYWPDINAYRFEDLRDDAGRYHWPVTNRLRPDLGPAENPVYVPYDLLLTGQRPNLLLPGYAVGAASMAWSALRVIPNACVLGDAAGVAAAHAVASGRAPAEFTDADVRAVQKALVQRAGARLEK